MSDIAKDIAALIDQKEPEAPEPKLGEKPMGKGPAGPGEKLKPFPHEYGPDWQKFIDGRKKRSP